MPGAGWWARRWIAGKGFMKMSDKGEEVKRTLIWTIQGSYSAKINVATTLTLFISLP